MKLASLLFMLLLAAAPLAAQATSSDPAGVLSQYKVAQFVGSGTESIQAMTSDAAGNIYVAGTTSSPDLPMLNAAQPAIGEAALLRSLDNGATWQKVPTPVFNSNTLTLTPHPSDPQTLFAATQSGIYRTTDGGRTWQLVYMGWSMSIAIDPGNPRFVYALVSDYYELIGSADGGNSWHKLPAPLSGAPFYGSFWVDPNGSGAVLVGYSLSRDHGLTWTPITSPIPPVNLSTTSLV